MDNAPQARVRVALTRPTRVQPKATRVFAPAFSWGKAESRGWEYARVLDPSLRTLNGFPWVKPKVRARYDVWARM